ncbi:hypothetical protein GCM10018966_096420 [Streptomyces yanii]
MSGPPSLAEMRRTVFLPAFSGCWCARLRLALAVPHYDRALERQQVARMLRRDVDALLIATADPPDQDPEMVEWLGSLDVPTVLAERSLSGPAAARIEYVRADHAASAEPAVEHLLYTGHTRVAAEVPLPVVAPPPRSAWARPLWTQRCAASPRPATWSRPDACPCCPAWCSAPPAEPPDRRSFHFLSIRRAAVDAGRGAIVGWWDRPLTGRGGL